MTPATVGALVAALAAVTGAYLSYRASTKANSVSERKVDLEEFRDQQQRYREMLSEADRHHERLRSQIDRMGAQMDGLQAQLVREQDISNALRSEIRALQGQVRALEQIADGRGLRPPTVMPDPPATGRSAE